MNARKAGIFDPWRQQKPELPPPPDLDTQTARTDPEKPAEETCLRLAGRHGGLHIYGPKNEMPDLGLVKLVEALKAVPGALRERYGVYAESKYPEDQVVIKDDEGTAFYVRVDNLARGSMYASDTLATLFISAKTDKRFMSLLEALQITPYIR